MLTREDIESFEFKLVKEYTDSLVFQKYIDDFEFIELEFNFDEGDGFINIERWNQFKMVNKVLPLDQWNCFNIFNGKIETKFALLFILKSIGVIEDE